MKYLDKYPDCNRCPVIKYCDTMISSNCVTLIKNQRKKSKVYNDAYNQAIQYLKEHKDFPEEKEMKLLVGQYYYGIAAQRELENLIYKINLPKS